MIFSPDIVTTVTVQEEPDHTVVVVTVFLLCSVSDGSEIYDFLELAVLKL